MAKPRLELQQLLKGIVPNVYFQPPPTLVMNYPAIVYEIDGEEAKYADNRRYHNDIRYTITIIDRNPDSAIPGKVEDLPLCAFSRFFVAENLNHFVYSLYF